MAYFTEHLVFALGVQDNILTAQVEDADDEDVVGVSKKMLQTLVDDLAGAEPAVVEEKVPAESTDAPVSIDGELAVKKPGAVETEEDGRVRQLIEKSRTCLTRA